MYLLKGIGFNFRNIVCDVKRHKKECVISIVLIVRLIHDGCIVNRNEQDRTIDLTTIQFTNAWLADSLNDFVLNLPWTKAAPFHWQFNLKLEVSLKLFFLFLYRIANADYQASNLFEHGALSSSACCVSMAKRLTFDTMLKRICHQLKKSKSRHRKVAYLKCFLAVFLLYKLLLDICNLFSN